MTEARGKERSSTGEGRDERDLETGVSSFQRGGAAAPGVKVLRFPPQEPDDLKNTRASNISVKKKKKKKHEKKKKNVCVRKGRLTLWEGVGSIFTPEPAHKNKRIIRADGRRRVQKEDAEGRETEKKRGGNLQKSGHCGLFPRNLSSGKSRCRLYAWIVAQTPTLKRAWA